MNKKNLLVINNKYICNNYNKKNKRNNNIFNNYNKFKMKKIMKKNIN